MLSGGQSVARPLNWKMGLRRRRGGTISRPSAPKHTPVVGTTIAYQASPAPGVLPPTSTSHFVIAATHDPPATPHRSQGCRLGFRAANTPSNTSWTVTKGLLLVSSVSLRGLYSRLHTTNTTSVFALELLLLSAAIVCTLHPPKWLRNYLVSYSCPPHLPRL